MKKAWALALVLATASSLAGAEASSGFRLRPFASIGYTFGGDTITHVTLTPVGGSGASQEEDVSAGGGLALQLGLDYKFGSLPFSMQASVGYHNDQVDGLTGRVAFRRVPVELLAFWHPSERWRLGFGARRATNATYDSRGGTDMTTNQPAADLKLKFKSTTGAILEGEYFMIPSWSIKARYVHETFTIEDIPGKKYDASHVGVLTSYYFN